MSVRHTPGPWSVPHFAQPEVNCECGYVLTDNLMGAVATVHCSGKGDDWKGDGDNPRFEEAVANAHLIAAAPELLASCVEFLPILERQLTGINPGGAAEASATFQTAKARVDRMRDAIAKAASLTTSDPS